MKPPCNPGQWTHIYPILGDSITETGSITCRPVDSERWEEQEKGLRMVIWFCHLDLCIVWDLSKMLRCNHLSKMHEVESQSPLPWFWSYESHFPVSFSKYETKMITEAGVKICPRKILLRAIIKANRSVALAFLFLDIVHPFSSRGVKIHRNKWRNPWKNWRILKSSVPISSFYRGNSRASVKKCLQKSPSLSTTLPKVVHCLTLPILSTSTVHVS